MKSPNRRPGEIEPTVERLVYAVAIRTALETLKPLLEGRPSVLVVFRLPNGADDPEYRTAGHFVMLNREQEERLDVLTPFKDRKGEVHFGDLISDIAEAERALVIMNADVMLPPEIIAAADAVVDLEPVSGRHLQIAAADGISLSLSADEAEELLRLPLDLVFAAMRPGRSFDDIVERVRQAEKQKPRLPTTFAPRLEELGGYGQARQWGLQLAEDVIAYRNRHIRWQDVDAGLLLSGPPGTGKTLFAAALARSCGLHFISASVAKWQSYGHLGDLLGAMRQAFKQAHDKAPSLLFIDEFDSIGDRARFSHDNANYSTQVVNGLLEAIDGSERREGVVIVGATNHPEAIDPAFLRSGRLGRHIHIGLPGFEDRKAIARTYFGSDMPDAEAERIAVATDGMTGADFAGIAKDVRRKARVGAISINASLVLACLPQALPLVGEERRTVSLHEAGHAVVGVTLRYGRLKAVAVVHEIRRTTAIGSTIFETRARALRSRQSYLDQICFRLGGIAAERVVLRTQTDGAGASDEADIAGAADLATLMVASLGMGSGLRYIRSNSLEDRDQIRRSMPDIEKEVGAILDEQLRRACSIVESRRPSTEKIAKLLEENGFLDGAEVEEILNGIDIDREAGE